ncbi:MAG: prevent-host-death protein [Legionellales bacterium RIFCSPHIGHO2_12_FULL_37_14]|nr:MAG: prevent-host-death protein [Legionellales bacterium RIFCSPHIGHO2_12_FULL_37_14]
MKTLNIRETRALIGQLDQMVEQSGEVIVTKYGNPILRILPIQEVIKRPFHKELRAKMPILRTPSGKLIREDRNERSQPQIKEL